MFELRNLALVNWHTVAKPRDIPMRGAVGVFGPNRAGKSTLLDAIHTVMLSNDRSVMQLNAAANTEGKRRNKRSVHSYCLGRLGDAKTPPLRSDCITHIALPFYDSASGRWLTTGMMFEARESETREIESARWIAIGVNVRSEDLVRTDGDNVIPLTWPELQEVLDAKCRAGGESLRTYVNGQEHVKDFLHLTAQAGRAGNVDQFKRAFANAYAFETIENETVFVRKHVLEPNPIRIADLRASISNYREIHQTILRLVEEVRQLDEIILQASRYRDTIEESDHMLWSAARAETIRVSSDWRQAIRERDDAADAVKSSSATILNDEKCIAALRDERNSLNSSLAASGKQIAVSEVDRQVSDLRLRKAPIEKTFKDWRFAIQRTTSIARLTGEYLHSNDALTFLRQTHAGIFNKIVSLADEDEADGEKWPKNAVRLNEMIAALPRLVPILDSLRDKKREAEGKAHHQEDLIGAWNKDLETIKDRGRLLRHETLCFVDDLTAMGMAPKLVCSEIDVTTKDWWDAVEAVMGDDLEAVVLPPEDALKAVRHYRANKDKYPGCRVVNTRRLEARPVVENSLADVVAAQDPRINAFVNLRLGNVRRVDTETELHAGGRAVARDCAYCDGLVTTVRRVHHRRIGRQAGASGREMIEESIRQARTRANSSLMTARAFEDLHDRLDVLARAIDFDGSFLEAFDALRDICLEETRLLEHRQTLIDSVAPEIAERLTQIPLEISQYEEEKGNATRERDIANRDLGAAQQRVNTLAPLREARIKTYLGASSQVVRPKAIAYWRALVGERRKFQKSFIDDLSSKAETLRNEATRIGRVIDSLIVEFRQHSGRSIELTIESSVVADILPWAVQLRDDIKSKDISRHEQRAAEAAEEAQRLFKGRFVSELRDRFAYIERAIASLNVVLARHDFHHETYRFEANPDAGFEEIIEFVNAAANNDDIMLPLFSGSIDGAPYEGALRTLNSLLMDDDAKVADFEHYQNYFTFNLLMKDTETRREVSFQHRQGTGSGAEKQVPFYVAIGAAVAGSYHPGRFNAAAEGGLGLALFDEAFMKMDYDTQKQVLAFYRDIGLQPVIAGPELTKSVMQRTMDTLVRVTRPKDKIMHTSVSHPGPRLKDELDKHDPTLWSRERIAEILTEREQRAAE